MEQHPIYGFYEPGWKPVLGYEGRYEVNDKCRVRNARTKKILKPSRIQQVGLISKHRNYKMHKIYHLSLAAFFPESTAQRKKGNP